MRARLLKLVSISIVFGSLAAAGASAALPPPPKAAGGQTVTQIAVGLSTPTSFAFGDGQIFAGDAGSENGQTTGGVFVLRNGTATKLPGSPPSVFGLAWHKQALYVSAGRKLMVWSSWNGAAFTKHKTIYTGPKHLTAFNGLAFGPDGRLYTGVSAITADDHGPTTFPYARDLLSFTASGKGPEIVATGIRQPWQMVFPAGSASPFISDLGQDGGAGAKTAPDFILRVQTGQSYGFPTCNWLTLSACSNDATPFKFLPAHTDAMGLGIIGRRLYISEFGAVYPPEVVSMPLTGGPTQPLLTGFAAPVVGLTTHAGAVYVGELTGQVFRVTP
jgi:hypothetical protein